MTPIITQIAAASATLGVLALVAYLFSLRRTQQTEKSLRRVIEGERLLNSGAVTDILRTYETDGARVEALKHILQGDAHRASLIYERIRKEIDVNAIVEAQGRQRVTGRLIAALVFLALAALAVTYGLQSGAGDNTPPAVGASSSGADTAVDAGHQGDGSVVAPPGVAPPVERRSGDPPPTGQGAPPVTEASKGEPDVIAPNVPPRQAATIREYHNNPVLAANSEWVKCPPLSGAGIQATTTCSFEGPGQLTIVPLPRARRAYTVGALLDGEACPTLSIQRTGAPSGVKCPIDASLPDGEHWVKLDVRPAPADDENLPVWLMLTRPTR